ncbi:MAG: TolC family protein [Saprospiraceae bacterium]
MKIRRYHPILLALLVWCSGNYLLAQQPLDLKTAMKYAVENHANIQKAKLDIDKGQQMVREALSPGLPQVNANAQILNNLALRTSLVPAEFFGGSPGEFQQVQFGTNWNGSAGIQLNQLVFDQTYFLGLKATRAVTDFYKIMLEKNKEDVIYEVAKIYYQIQLSRTNRGILNANLDQIEGLLTVTTKQYDNGFAKKIDVDRLRVQQSNLETQIKNLDLQIGQAEQALKFAMNMPLETDILLTDTITEATSSAVDFATIQPSYEQKPDLLALRKQQELYGYDERRWKAGFYPSVALFANYTYEWQANNFGDITNGDLWFDYSQIGLSFNIPIFDGFYKSSKIQTARLNAMQTLSDYRLALLGMQLKHVTAVSTMQVYQNNLRSVEETRKVAEEVYRVAQSRFREGLAPITELLDAETSMRESQTNYITTLAQIKLAEIDLLNANGLLIKMIE